MNNQEICIFPITPLPPSLEKEHKKQIAESLDTLRAAHEAHKTELLRAQELVQRQST